MLGRANLSVKATTWFSKPRHLAVVRPRRMTKCLAAAAATDASFMFHVGNTSFTIPLPQEPAQQLSTSIQSVLHTLAEKQKAERPKRWQAMEYKFKGSGNGEVDYMEVFCNPNAHTNAFDAKVLITVVNAGMRVTTEGSLTALKSDVDVYLEQQHTQTA